MMKAYGNYNFGAQEGWSLVELLVVIVIISVVASLALMQRGNANEQFKRQNVARELKVAYPEFMVCNGASCPTAPGDAASNNTVLVTATGTVNILGGGVAIPTFTDPPVGNPPVVIRQEVVLP